ncbi:U32 family peptidase [Sellimonas intestinalis]|uniref:U32 family peptidase n=1 Tax=Sellimonas intestinalis TaxID=1653434 RepID=UPI0015EB3C36|nr:U32 family peptidase [Sellimonas intestinalis]MBA2213310.1 U32 family peptidase [Sellimonas intestinalis]
MKIVTPLCCVENYERLVDAGADEFFCGYNSHSWLEQYANIVPMNRREYLLSANICSLEEMKILSSLVEKYKKPVKITLNSLFYLRKQYDEIVKVIKQLMQYNFNTFIISDIALIMYLYEQKLNCKIHLSGETAEVNSLMIDMLKKYNITRFVFHRKNSIEEIRSCIENCDDKNIEFEAFMLNELCPYTGAFCGSWHCDELLHICKLPFKVEKFNSDLNCFADVEKNMTVYNRASRVNFRKINDDIDENYRFGVTGCGACKIFELEKAGVGFVKVVGRDKKLDLIEKDIRILRKLLDCANDFSESSEYSAYVKKAIGHCNEMCYYR